MTSESNTQRGSRGEDLAAAFLENLGYRVLERNYRFEHCEVDLVCFEEASIPQFGGEIVFVEVKMRTDDDYGRPEEAVHRQKQRRIVRAAQAWLYERKMEGAPCRFDVVSISFRNSVPEYEHFKDAFWAKGED